MIEYGEFQMEMARLFNMFTLGEAVIKVNDPDQMYMMYEMFRDTSIIFCNTNKMTDVDLIASVAQNRLRCLDLSKDRLFGHEHLMPSPEHRLKTRALYYYLKEGNFGFKGFPVYLHVLFKWDDSKYALDPTMLRAMNIPQNYLRQVEFMYASNQDLMGLNEMNPLTLIPITIGNTSALWAEVPPDITEDDDEFIPSMLVHRLNEKRRYPIAIIPDLGLYDIQDMVYTYNQALARCSMSGVSFINQVIRSFATLNSDGKIDRCTLLGDDSKGNTAKSLIAVNDLLIVMNGEACFYFEKKEHFDVFAALFDFQAFDLVSTYQVPQDPETQEMIPFWFWFNEWRRVQMRVTGHPELQEIRFTETHYLAYKEIDKRMMYALNAVQNLTLSMPCLGGTLPPRFIWALRDIVIEEKAQEELPPEPKED